MKKILILSTTYGQGHIATAEAIEEGLESAFGKKYEVEIIDFTETISSLLNKTSRRIYEDATKYAPVLYKMFFESTDYRLPIKAFNELNYRLSREKILSLFIGKQPDLIICNSPHWQYIASLARQDGLRDIPLISVITDSISIHTAWAVGDSDYYVVPNHETAQALHRLFIPNSQIKELGYPIRLDFLNKKFDRATFLARQAIPDDKPIILYLAAGLRSTMIKQTVAQLQKNLPDCRTVIITGRDTDLVTKLKSLESSHIRVIGWTSEMPEFIMASHIIVTKAGGSTIMECIGAHKPVVVNKIIPGQEQGNADYITMHGLGIVALEPEMAALATQKILSKYSSYVEHLKKVARPEATLDIAQFIDSLLKK